MSSVTRVYVFDLDGVLYRGEAAIEGAAEALATLRAKEPPIQLFFLTNNSSQPRRVYAEKLTRLGMPVQEEEIVTSASATALYLSEQEAVGKTALMVGGPGIYEELGNIGLNVRRYTDPEDPQETIDYVVVGLDKDFNYHGLNRAQQAILRGATFIATNRDGQFPMEGGRVTPGGGAMVAAIEACTDVRPIVIGKPEPLGLQMILNKANAQPREAVMIGDRLDTDILCGNRLGVPTVLVLTGVTSLEQAYSQSVSSAMRPGRIISSLSEL